MDFSRIHFDFNPFKMAKKGYYLRRNHGPAWRGVTCVDATWHARPRASATRTRGHLRGVDVARMRGRATRAHADALGGATWHEE